MKKLIYSLFLVIFMLFSYNNASAQTPTYGFGFNSSGVSEKQYMTIANHADFQYGVSGQSFSISCWVWLNDANVPTAPSANLQAIVSKRPVGTNKNDGYRLGIHTHRLYTDFSTSNGSNYASAKEDALAFNESYGKWCHIGFVVDASLTTKQARLYKNGVFIQAVNLPSQTAENTDDIYIFCGTNDGKTTFFSSGDIAELRFWKKALSAEEMTADMTASVTASTTDLIAAYNFRTITKEGGDIVVADIKGNHPGKLHNFLDYVLTSAADVPLNSNSALLYNSATNEIYFDNVVTGVRIYSTTGKLMIEQNSVNNLNISYLPKGVYLVEYEINNELRNQKIAKIN